MSGFNWCQDMPEGPTLWALCARVCHWVVNVCVCVCVCGFMYNESCYWWWKGCWNRIASKPHKQKTGLKALLHCRHAHATYVCMCVCYRRVAFAVCTGVTHLAEAHLCMFLSAFVTVVYVCVCVHITWSLCIKFKYLDSISWQLLKCSQPQWFSRNWGSCWL